MTTTATPLSWDPLGAQYKGDPHAIWRRLRDEAPVYYNAKHDFYALSRFVDVDAAHRDPKTFSSAHGTVLELMGPDILGGMMIFTDPPDHTRLRRLVSKAFTPRRMAELETDIRTLCGDLLDAQVGNGTFDYVQDFGARVPATVIAALLGVAPGHREEMRELIDGGFHLDPEKGMANDVSAQYMAELHAYISAQLEERQRVPRDDMFTDLLQGEILDDDGQQRRLTFEESTMFALLLASAGTETVARLIGWAGLVLAAHPDQRAEPAVTSAHSPTPTASTSTGRWTTTSRSATASTSASVPLWLASRVASPSRRRCGASPNGRSTLIRRCPFTPAPCGATPSCRSPSELGRLSLPDDGFVSSTLARRTQRS